MADDDAATGEGRALTLSAFSEAGPSETACGGGPPVAGNSHVEDGDGDESNLDRSLSKPSCLSTGDFSSVISLPVLEDRPDEGKFLLPSHLLCCVLCFFPLKELFQASAICKDFREILKTGSFLDRRASRIFVEECSLSALALYVLDGSLHILGYDIDAKTWMRLPPIPAPNLDEGEGPLVAGDSGIICSITRSAGGPENFVVWNPLTKERRDLPSLNNQRHPTAINIQVTAAVNQYKVLAAGSSPRGNFSKNTEVYDSGREEWTDAPDVPENFSLSDSQQSGALCKSDGRVYFLGRVQRSSFDSPEAVLAFDMEKFRWSEEFWVLPFRGRHHCQLVGCGGEILLFSRELSGRVEIQHIHRLNFLNEGGSSWTPKVRHRIERVQHDLVKPEDTCVPFGEARLGIFKSTFELNVMSESICEVYDITEDESVETEASHSLPSPPLMKGAVVVPANNYLGFAFQPSFYTEC